MKRWLTIMALMFLLVGCHNGEINKSLLETDLQTSEADQGEIIEEEEDGDPTSSESETEMEDTVVEQKEPLYEIDGKTWAVVPINEANEKVVLLTIDDAPDKQALEMAHTLKDLRVKAIYFVNGHFIDTEEKAAVLKEIYDLGFPIGNHTFSHQNLTTLEKEEQLKEIVSVNDRVEEITGERPRFFRAPFGANTDESKKIAAEEKMLIMNWTYGYDWEKEYQNKDALTQIMINSPYLNNGANLLMHDRAWTSEALEGIVKGLQEKGYKFVDPDLIRTLE
ncbi:polysaccharide deacetylase family protein [Robertmurraya massiliosenegalensis]|uniref:polysaccharide deacetylase family protein n=1 Tax=Robertmurraya TaxID=2837507 RepID=UPI0039A41D5F